MGTTEHYRECAANRAERLASLIRNKAPDCIVGADWHLLWEAMAKGFGPEVLERGGAMWDRIHAAIEDDDRSN